MRALTVVESQVYTDHNVDMHQSDSCMFDSAAQNLVSISGCKTFSYLCHTLGCINANTATNPSNLRIRPLAVLQQGPNSVCTYS